jgi:hypothetical protein
VDAQALSPPSGRGLSPVASGVAPAAAASESAACAHAPASSQISSLGGQTASFAPAPESACMNDALRPGSASRPGAAPAVALLGAMDHDVSIASYESAHSEGDVLAMSGEASDQLVGDVEPGPPLQPAVGGTSACPPPQSLWSTVGDPSHSASLDEPTLLSRKPLSTAPAPAAAMPGGRGCSNNGSNAASACSGSFSQLRSPQVSGLRIDVPPPSAAPPVEASAPVCASRDSLVPSDSRRLASPKRGLADSVHSPADEAVHTSSPLHRGRSGAPDLAAANATTLPRCAAVDLSGIAPGRGRSLVNASNQSSSNSFNEVLLSAAEPAAVPQPAPPLAAPAAPPSGMHSMAPAASLPRSPTSPEVEAECSAGVKRSFQSAAAALGSGCAGSSGTRSVVPLSNASAAVRGSLYTCGAGAGGPSAAGSVAAAKESRSLSARIMRIGASDSEGSSDEAAPPAKATPARKAASLAGFAGGFSPFGGDSDDSFS